MTAPDTTEVVIRSIYQISNKTVASGRFFGDDWDELWRHNGRTR